MRSRVDLPQPEAPIRQMNSPLAMVRLASLSASIVWSCSLKTLLTPLMSMILFGLGAKSAFALVCLGAFYPILLNTVFGVRSVDPRLFEAASMLGCTANAQFFKVVLPAATPSIFTGLRLGLGLAWFVIVVGEMTGVPQGLGAVIMDARTLSRTDLVICGMIVIGLAGYVSDRVVVAIGNRLLRWSPNHHG